MLDSGATEWHGEEEHDVSYADDTMWEDSQPAVEAIMDGPDTRYQLRPDALEVHASGDSIPGIESDGSESDAWECDEAAELWTATSPEEVAEKVKRDPFYPFKNVEEMWFANWAQTVTKLSLPRINALLEALRNPVMDLRKITFRTGEAMWKKVDALANEQGAAAWTETPIAVEGPKGSTYGGKTALVTHRPLVDVVKGLFQRDDLDIRLRAKKAFNDMNPPERLYNEAWTGDRWSRIQVRACNTCACALICFTCALTGV